MKLIIKGVLAVFFIASSLSVFAAAPERVLWNKTPISVHIQKGEERIIHFPDDIRYWLPDSIKPKVSVLAANGVLYIQAIDRFSTTRIRVQGLVDQQVYLLDLFSTDQVMTTPELIVMTSESVTNRSHEIETAKQTEDWRVRLTRHAAQHLYAPERLLEVADSRIKRVPLNVNLTIPLIRGGVMDALPIAAWQANGLTVVAIRLQNLTEKPYRLGFGSQAGDLDLAELIRGNWLTATLQHDSIGANGGDDDSTVLYLVSNRSFEDSLRWMMPIMPRENNVTLNEEPKNG